MRATREAGVVLDEAVPKRRFAGETVFSEPLYFRFIFAIMRV